MINYLKITFGIFLLLCLSRFIPHPPNFTSLIALSFYVPAMLGKRFLPAILFSFILTDLIIGLHGVLIFTWGSVIIIGLMSVKLSKSLLSRIFGSLFGAVIFFIVTNFGVWSLGSYGYTLEVLIICYTFALPFFGYTLISTLLFSVLIETIMKSQLLKKFLFKFT